MKSCIDTTKEYGLVLEGGGAKGSFQIGVWKALVKAGVKIRGIAGSSVGGLNGAMIASGELSEAESIWENLSYSQVMDVKDEHADAFLNGKMPLTQTLSAVREFIRNRGIDADPLKELIAKSINCEKIRAFPGDLSVVSYNLGKGEGEVIDLRSCTDEEIRDYLLATAYMPVFRLEKTREQILIDGGAWDNVPIGVLLEKGYKDIIVVRIHGIGLKKPVRIPKDVNVIEILPEEDLGGILEFTKESAKRNIAMGYCTAMRVLYGLPGKKYYFLESEESERDCLERMLELADCADPSRETGLMELLRIRSSRYRAWLEQTLPGYARELSLGLEWTYRELWTAMLEEAAELTGIGRYEIYAEKKLMELIAEQELPEDAPEHTKTLMCWLKSAERVKQNGTI